MRVVFFHCRPRNVLRHKSLWNGRTTSLPTLQNRWGQHTWTMLTKNHIQIKLEKNADNIDIVVHVNTYRV